MDFNHTKYDWPVLRFKKKKQVGKLHLVLFIHEKILNISTIIKTEVILLDKLSVIRSKGAISFTLRLFNSHFIFATVHLAPHQFNVRRRIKQMNKLFNALKLKTLVSTSCKHEGNFKKVKNSF